jgi:hypothetical protein
MHHETLRIWPFSRRLAVPFSPEIAEVEVCPSPYCAGFTIALRNHRSDGTETVERNALARHRISNSTLEIVFPPGNAVDYRQVEGRSAGLWPIVRRILTEARDRTQPILSLASAR